MLGVHSVLSFSVLFVRRLYSVANHSKLVCCFPVSYTWGHCANLENHYTPFGLLQLQTLLVANEISHRKTVFTFIT